MNFLISGLGGDVAQSLSKIVSEEFPESKVIGLDVSQRNAARLFCDEFIICPLANDKNYLHFIENIMISKEIDLFIPCTEVELHALSFNSFPESLKKKIVSCSNKIISICLDKFKTYDFLLKNGLSVPWFSENTAGINGRFPCLYKKRTSSGSKGMFLIKNQIEAEFFEQYSPNGVFQEVLDDDENEVTCAIFRGDGEKFRCLQLLRELKDGSTSWAKKIDDSSIFEFCKSVADIMDLRGSFNIQLKRTSEGPKILEINPRFSSTVYMRHLMGFKDAKWTIELFLKGKISLEEQPLSDREIVKVFSAEFL